MWERKILNPIVKKGLRGIIKRGMFKPILLTGSKQFSITSKNSIKD
jgi:hypothetical protein